MADPFENKHIRDIIARNKQIEATLDRASKDLARRFKTVKGKRFAKVLQTEIKSLRESIKADITKGATAHWKLANTKNAVLSDGYLRNIPVSESLYKSFRAPNLNALNSFLNRTEKGMNLSKRVWSLTNEYEKRIQEYLSSGITVGKSATQISKELQRYIKGEGIPYKGVLLKGSNVAWQAYRLTASEINMAYRMSDHLKFKQLPMVLGVRVNLARAHPRIDICDEFAGDYPKGFQFLGWHPICICYPTPILMSKEDFVKFMKTGQIAKRLFVNTIPKNTTTFLKTNASKIAKYKEKPYWIRDNFTNDLTLYKSISKVKIPKMELVNL